MLKNAEITIRHNSFVIKDMGILVPEMESACQNYPEWMVQMSGMAISSGKVYRQDQSDVIPLYTLMRDVFLDSRLVLCGRST